MPGPYSASKLKRESADSRQTPFSLSKKVTHKFVNPVEVNRRINLTEHMVRWTHLLQTN